MKLSLEELKSAVADYIDGEKIAINEFIVTRNNIVGLLDKIGKIVALDSNFYDKLGELDGEDLTEGKTIEEYFQDLILAQTWDGDAQGQKALKFYSPTYRPVAYSYSFGRKVIPQSIPNNNIERAVNNSAQATSIVALMTKRMSDSRDAWKYQCKRELLGKLCDKIITAYEDAEDWEIGDPLVEGNYYKDTLASGNVAVCVKARAVSSSGDWSTLVAQGYLIELQMRKVVAKPVDTTTGEAFIKAVKEVVEASQDISEGFSLNGNTIGAEVGLSMYVKHGVMPSLEVDTLSGAFHLDKMGMGVTAKTIKDFGETTSKAYAILVDSRGVRLHKDYEAMRENLNGYGDFLNLFQHLEYTGFLSRNTFVTIFVEEGE